MNLKVRVLGLAMLLLALTGCSNGNKPHNSSSNTNNSYNVSVKKGQNKIGLKEASNPKYKPGQKVEILAKHMKGMYKAKGTVVNVYTSKLYMIDYKSTTTNKIVKNHKWVTSDEIKGQRKQYKKGDKVTIKADHMAGMKNSSATIAGVSEGPAYMVNYKSTTTHKTVKNHKWVAENELAPR